jgi:hypothetical protein
MVTEHLAEKSKYKLAPKGQQYVSTPTRDSNGRVSAHYFKKLILLFAIERGDYEPTKFKE